MACRLLVAACELLVAACMRDLVPRPGIEPGPPALGVWSLTHWTTRGVPGEVALSKSSSVANESLQWWRLFIDCKGGQLAVARPRGQSSFFLQCCSRCDLVDS